MKKTIFALLCCTPLLCACTPEEVVVPERDWANTTYLFSSDDEQQSDTYYKPYVGYVGDPMPFYDPVNKEFKVCYLQDYRPNPAATYHPVWGLRTTDAAHYESVGEVIPCGATDEQDAALGTGSFVWDEAQQLYYCFYTGHKYQLAAGDNREAVMYATSPDFRTWTKCKTFVLRGGDYGYSTNDFRDPFVFQGDDNLYHMLVSTTRGGKGTIAEFVSADLQHWTHQGAFMTMMWDRFYECPDVFKMGDWWYLVYSDQNIVRRVQYFKGRTLDELKACTAADAGLWPDAHEGFLDSRGFYAGKTASDGTNRYIWGWCPTRNGRDNTQTQASATKSLDWAGSLVAHRLLQHEDGTLTLQPVQAIAQKYTTAQPVRIMREQGIISKAAEVYTLEQGSNLLFSRLGYHNHLSFTVTTASAEDRFGISLCRGTSMVSDADSSVYYSLIINPEDATHRKLNFEQEGEGGMGFIADIDSYVFATPADNTYHIDLYTDNSVLVVYINDALCYTNRVYGMSRNCWSVNAYTGTITLSDLKHTTY